MKRIDLTGQRFGYLTVIEKAKDHITKSNRVIPMWKCKCDCGQEIIANGWSITNGDVKSCGCYRKIVSSQKRKTNNFDINRTCLFNDGKVILFDQEDFYKISGYTWHINKDGYPVTFATENGKRKCIPLHSLILDYDSKIFEVDHINGDKTDNRKSNLRIVIHANNLKNQKLSVKNTSGHKGVSWDKHHQKWNSYINCNGIRYNLGYFDSLQCAINVRESTEKDMFGEYSRNNKYL